MTSITSYEISDNKLFGINSEGIPLVDISENGIILLTTYSKGNNENMYRLRYSTTGLIFESLPILDKAISVGKISKDGNYAIQFTENGTITLTAHTEADYTVIKVSDTGIGMAENELPAIWERFYKTDPSRKNNKYGESGIGLAIVKSLIDSHNGKIEVESARDKGTTFTIKFPKELNEKN